MWRFQGEEYGLDKKSSTNKNNNCLVIRTVTGDFCRTLAFFGVGVEPQVGRARNLKGTPLVTNDVLPARGGVHVFTIRGRLTRGTT